MIYVYNIYIEKCKMRVYSNFKLVKLALLGLNEREDMCPENI